MIMSMMMMTMKYNKRYRPLLNVQRIAFIALSIGAVLIFCGIAFAVFRPLMAGPSIAIEYSPPDEFGAIEVSGTTRRAVNLSLDGRMIPITVDNTFATTITIPPGSHTRTFMVKDRFDKESSASFTIYRPPHERETLAHIINHLHDNDPPDQDIDEINEGEHDTL